MDFVQKEKETFLLINEIRANPQMIVSELEELATYFKGKTYKVPGTKVNIVTAEGVAAVNEAIQFIKVLFPLLLITE
jgi:hypothetical protein